MFPPVVSPNSRRMDTEHDPIEAAPAPPPHAETEHHARNDHPASPAGPEETMQAAAERINGLETELAAMRENWLRSEAEAQNVRTRARRDVEDARQFAVTKFARDVVEAAENLRRGITALPAPAADEDPMLAKLREGFEGVERSFVGILERNGIQAADPTGEKFDANLHQAMAEQPSDTVPAGQVLAAWTRAWTLNGRLLKPAMVVVSKGSGDAASVQGIDTTA